MNAKECWRDGALECWNIEFGGIRSVYIGMVEGGKYK
jgi:hypothetical protein